MFALQPPLQPLCIFSCPTLAPMTLSDAVGWWQAGWIKAEPGSGRIRQGPGSRGRGRGRAVPDTSPCTAACCLQKQASKAGHKGCCGQPCNLAAVGCLCALTQVQGGVLHRACPCVEPLPPPPVPIPPPPLPPPPPHPSPWCSEVHYDSACSIMCAFQQDCKCI